MDEQLKDRLEQLNKTLQIEDKKRQIENLKQKLGDEKIWKNWEEGQKLSKELSIIQTEIEDYETLKTLAKDGTKKKFEEEIRKLELKTFLSGKHDKANALLSIHAGQGGTEAMDWSEMLLRMYKRYAEIKNWDIKEIMRAPGDEAGIKTAVLEIEGPYAYGFLKNESGVHRLVRQSPFNSDNLRQTSFALVEVIPVIEGNIEIELKEEDLEWDFFRSGGKGGQNVNKVSTAVRVKHTPSGIIVECQEERHQGRNREKALKILKSKLYQKEVKKAEEEKNKLKGTYKTPGWGNQIRNYILHPYKLVKDVRTGVESTSPEKVLDGDLDMFVEAEIKL